MNPNDSDLHSPSPQFPFRISRSELELHGDCNYAYDLHSLIPGPQGGSPFSAITPGVRRFFRKSSLMIGGGIHKGVGAILEGAHEDSAVAHALSHLNATRISPDHESRELSDFEYLESRAIVESLTRLFARRVITPLTQQYNILGLEEEVTRDLFEGDPSMEGQVEFPARADAILEDKSSGDIGVLSLKTSKYIEIPGERTSTGRLIYDTQRFDMQGISELWTLKSRYPNATFIQFVTLRKGDIKLHDTKELRQAGIEPFHYYNLPLLTGWKQATGLGGDNFAWAWDYWKSDPATGERSKSALSWAKWKRFWPFLPHEIGIRVWMDLLERDDGAVIPSSVNSINGKAALDSLVQYGSPIYRTEEEEVEWLVQTRAIVKRLLASLSNGIHLLNPDSREDRLRILEEFPRNRRSCVYPARCEYFSHCHEGTAIVDEFLQESERMFVPREDNHPRSASLTEAVIPLPQSPEPLVSPVEPSPSVEKRECRECGKALHSGQGHNICKDGTGSAEVWLCDFCFSW